MKRIIPIVRDFARQKKASVAVEFAFVFPLMAVTYMFLGDASIAMNDNRRLQEIATSTSQVAASFPAYDQTARMSAVYNISAYQQFLNGRELRVDLVSLKKEKGVIKQLFAHKIAGEGTGMDYKSVIENVDYRDGDNIIVVLATLRNRSYLSKFLAEGTFVQASAQTQSYNSRSYEWNAGTADADYYNWQ